MNAQLEKTGCPIPFSAALEASAWREYLQRFTNQIDCTHCKREFMQDTEYGTWHPSEACEFGSEPDVTVQPIVTQQGWFCGEDCHAEHMEAA